MSKKPLDQIGLEITGAMAAADEAFASLLAATSPDNTFIRKQLGDKRGEIMCALAFYEGYLSALRAGRGTSIFEPGPIVRAHGSKYPTQNTPTHEHRNQNGKI